MSTYKRSSAHRIYTSCTRLTECVQYQYPSRKTKRKRDQRAQEWIKIGIPEAECRWLRWMHHHCRSELVTSTWSRANLMGSEPSTSNQSSSSTSSSPSLNNPQPKQQFQSNKQNRSKNSGNRKPRPYDKHLGSDGKLKLEEKERRNRLGLCVFCGENHKFEDCPHRRRGQPRGRAAQTQEQGTSELPAIPEVPEN